MKRKLPDLNPKPPRKRPLSDEERALWEDEMAGRKKPPMKAAEKKKISSPHKPAAPVTPKPAPDGGVDRRTAERLRKGKLEIEATLDMHGMTQAKAHAALLAFIDRAASRGKRVLLVITGKGLGGAARAVGRSPERGGILRTQLPRWLAEPALSPRILAFTPAAVKDGGDGAFYVLLRRQR